MNNVCKRTIRQVKKNKSDKAVKAGETKGKFALSVAVDNSGNRALALTKGHSCP